MAGMATLEASGSLLLVVLPSGPLCLLLHSPPGISASCCTPLRAALFQAIQPEVLVASDACHAIIIINISVNGSEENVRNYAEEGSITARGKC